MSQLQDLCIALAAIDQDILKMAGELDQRAQSYNRAAQQAAAIIHTEDGRTNPAAAQAATALSGAARSCTQAAQLLSQAANEGQAFVGRTAGGSGGQGQSSQGHEASNPEETGWPAPQAEFTNAVFKTDAGSAFFSADDAGFRNAASDVPMFPGEYVLDLHGTPDSVQLANTGVNYELNAQEFAEVVRQSTEWSGQPIRLFSCDTGRNAGGFAQKLANELGVPVRAPTTPVWSVGGRGTPIVSDVEWKQVGGQWRAQPEIPPNGKWLIFNPE